MAARELTPAARCGLLLFMATSRADLLMALDGLPGDPRSRVLEEQARPYDPAVIPQATMRVVRTLVYVAGYDTEEGTLEEALLFEPRLGLEPVTPHAPAARTPRLRRLQEQVQGTKVVIHPDAGDMDAELVGEVIRLLRLHDYAEELQPRRFRYHLDELLEFESQLLCKIIDTMVERSTHKVVRGLQEEFGFPLDEAYGWVQAAQVRMRRTQEVPIEDAQALQVARLEVLYERAMEMNDTELASRIARQITAVRGLNRIEVKTTSELLYEGLQRIAENSQEPPGGYLSPGDPDEDDHDPEDADED